MGDFGSALFPAPLDVAKAFAEITGDGTLADGVTASMFRFVIGYLLSVVAGIGLGLLIGNVNILFRLTNPVIQMIRPIAPVAWMPFIVLLIGIGDTPAIVIIFLAGFFPVLLTTARECIQWMIHTLRWRVTTAYHASRQCSASYCRQCSHR